MKDKWYDVKDQQGVWRIGQCLLQDNQGNKMISLDGFHPSYTTTYCKHSTQVLSIRSKTYGLTLLQGQQPLRQVLTHSQIQKFSGKLNLFLMKPNYLQFEPKLIRTTIRTQFLILIDKIVTTPFEIIRQIKMMDLEVSKFFINILNFYTRIIQFSKVFMPIIQTNQIAQQIYKSIYQLTVMANLIFGIHPHSSKLYQHKLNLNLKSGGFIDYFVMSEVGLMPFRNLFKGISTIKQPNQFDYQIIQIVANLFLDLCEKAKNYITQGNNQSKTMLVLDQIINAIKHIAQLNQTLKQKMSKNLSLISKIQAIYFKFRSNKTCPLRKFLVKQQQKPKQVIVEAVTSSKTVPGQRNISDEQFLTMQERIKKLQTLITNQQRIPSTSPQLFKGNVNFERPNLPMQNLGQQMFLGSLQYALQTGDLETAKKLTKWRRSLLQVGRITGWEVALSIGLRTYQKQQITATDIIQANYQHIAKSNK